MTIGLHQGVASPKAPPPTTPGVVLLHPDHAPGDPNACRLIALAVTYGEWPWMRLTGLPSDVPSRGDELRGWRAQSLAEVGQVLGT